MPGSPLGALFVFVLAASPANRPTDSGADARGLPTSISVDPCLGAEREEVRRLVSLELGVPLVDTSSRSSGLRVWIGCEGDSAIALAVDDPITHKSLGRTVDRSLAPQEGQARLLALAVAELVAASWTELAVNPKPKVRPLGPLPEPEWQTTALASLRRREHPLELRAIGGLMQFPGRSGPLSSGGLRLGQSFSSTFAWTGELSAFHGRETTSRGAVALNGGTAAATIGAHQRFGPLELRAGVGVRGGVTAIAGRSSATVLGETVFGPWWGPMGMVSLAAPIFEFLVIEVSAEGGYSAWSVVGRIDDAEVVAVGGPWVSAQAGLGVLFW